MIQNHGPVKGVILTPFTSIGFRAMCRGAGDIFFRHYLRKVEILARVFSAASQKTTFIVILGHFFRHVEKKILKRRLGAILGASALKIFLRPSRDQPQNLLRNSPSSAHSPFRKRKHQLRHPGAEMFHGQYEKE